jgi:hypothetical protein
MIKRMVAVWELSNHGGSALLLLLAIADYADENGLAWPGTSALAQKTRLYRGGIPRVIDRLCASGELLAMNRLRQRSNLYVVTPGLTPEQLAAAIERARAMGATSIRGKDDLTVPKEVLEVVSGGHHPKEVSSQGVHQVSSQGVHHQGEVSSQGVQVSSQGVHVYSQGGQGVLTGRIDPSLSVIDPSKNQGDVSFLWKQILADLRGSMAEGTFNINLLDSKVVAADNGTWTVLLKSAMAVEWVGNRLRPMVERTVERYASGVALEFVSKAGGQDGQDRGGGTGARRTTASALGGGAA